MKQMNQIQQPDLIFVYGTLMKNMGNDEFLKNATFLGPATTCEQYTMYIANMIIPKVVMRPSYHISGELYSVSNTDMKRVDILEGKYSKKLIKVKSGLTDLLHEAYIYIWTSPISAPPHEINTTGNYKKYMSED